MKGMAAAGEEARTAPGRRKPRPACAGRGPATLFRRSMAPCLARLLPASRLLPSRLLGRRLLAASRLLASRLLGGCLLPASRLLARRLLGRRLLPTPRLLARRLLGGHLLSAASLLASRLLLSSCHNLGYPPVRVLEHPGCAYSQTSPSAKRLNTARASTASLLSPPIGGWNARLEGNLPSFFYKSAALEPLLRLTVTPGFRARQVTNVKKTRRWEALLRAANWIPTEFPGVRHSGPRERTAPAIAHRCGSRRALPPRTVKRSYSGELALPLVAGALQELALLVLAHLLAALFDDAAHGPSERIDGSRGQLLAVGREVNCLRRRTGCAFT